MTELSMQLLQLSHGVESVFRKAHYGIQLTMGRFNGIDHRSWYLRGIPGFEVNLR